MLVLQELMALVAILQLTPPLPKTAQRSENLIRLSFSSMRGVTPLALSP